MSTVATGTRRAMPLAGHLAEARSRLTRSALALLVAIVAGFLLSDLLLDVVREPVLTIAESREASLNYDTVSGAFDLKVRLAILAGIVLASPVWLYQLLAYIAPALTRREKRYAFGFLGAALPLFVAGCAMGLLLVPHVVELLAGFGSAADSALLTASSYVDFVVQLVLASGLALTLPVGLVLLNVVGVLPAQTMRRGWRVGLVAVLVVSALVTPAADVAAMGLVALPMICLGVAAYVVALLHDRTLARRTEGAR